MEAEFNGRRYWMEGSHAPLLGNVRTLSGILLLGYSVDADTGATHVLGYRGGEWRGADFEETVSRALREIGR